MSQPFCQSKEYRDLSIWELAGLSEEQAHDIFAQARWGSTTVMPCPICGTVDKHYPRHTKKQWRCKDCDAVFSVTTETPFADRKLSFKKLVMLIYEFVSAPTGCAANRLHSRLDITHKTAYLNLSKLREVLWEQRDQSPFTGVVHIDGGHFCGKPRRGRKRNKVTSTIVNNKLRNRKAGMVPDKSVTHAEPWNVEKFKNRRIVLVIRKLCESPKSGAERTMAIVVKSENAANVLPVIRRYVDTSAQIHTDQSNCYNQLSAWYDHRTVNHSVEYATDEGITNNQAESFFGRMRRSEYGVYNGMRPQYLAFFANEYAWREDMKAKSLREKFDDLLQKACRSGHSKAWRGYQQGHRLGLEYMN